MGGTPRERVVEVTAQTATGHRYGSGCLIAPGLVLTAYHVACPERGVAVRVRDLRGRAAEARVVWSDHDLDVALLAGDPAVGEAVYPVQWGELVCDDPSRRPVCTAAGFPTGMARRTDDAGGEFDDVKVVDGHIKPTTGLRSGLYVWELDDAVPKHHDQWQGMSGAGVFCEGALIGVAVSVRGNWQARALNAVPVHRLLTAPGFRDAVTAHTGGTPHLQPADLRPVLTTAPRPQLSSSYLLNARARVVPLNDMRRLLGDIQAWCMQETALVDVALVTGHGGVGKTRLIPELLDLLPPLRHGSSAGRPWCGGFLARRPRAAPEILATADRPLLIAVDQAEARHAQIEELLDALDEEQPAGPVRVLLIARAHDAWWPFLRGRYRGDGTIPHGRTAYTVAVSDALRDDPENTYVDAKTAFARRIRALRSAGHGDATWKNTVVADAPRTYGPTTANTDAIAPIVHLHAAALADVLVRANPDFAHRDNPWGVLLAHERDYWRQILEPLHADPYDGVMHTMVAVQYLAGAATTERAQAAVEAAYDVHHHGYATTARPTAAHLTPYLTALTRAYPGEDGRRWGGIGPEHLAAEHLVHVERKHGMAFLERLLPHSFLDQDQRRHALARATRAAALQPDLVPGTCRAVAAAPDLLLGPAIEAACTQLDPEQAMAWLDDLADVLAEPAPHVGTRGASIPRTPTARTTAALQRLHDTRDKLAAGTFDLEEFLTRPGDNPNTTACPAQFTGPDTDCPHPVPGPPAPREPADADPASPSPQPRATESSPASSASDQRLPRPPRPRLLRTSEPARAPAGFLVRAVLSVLAVGHLGFFGYAGVRFSMGHADTNPAIWGTPLVTVGVTLVFGVAVGYVEVEKTAWVWPLLAAALNAVIGIVTNPFGADPATTVGLGTVIALNGQVCTIYAARAWLGQVRWNFELERD